MGRRAAFRVVCPAAALRLIGEWDNAWTAGQDGGTTDRARVRPLACHVHQDPYGSGHRARHPRTSAQVQAHCYACMLYAIAGSLPGFTGWAEWARG